MQWHRLTLDTPVLRARDLTHRGAEEDGKGIPEVPKPAPRPQDSLGQKPTEHGERALEEFVLKLQAIFFPCLYPEPTSLTSVR